MKYRVDSILRSHPSKLFSGSTLIRHHLAFFALALAVATLPFSIALCHGGLILFLVIVASEGNWQRKWNTIRENRLLQLLLIFMAITLVGISYSENSSNAWFVVEKRLFLFLVPLAIAVSDVHLSRKDIDWLCRVFVLACLCGSLICIAVAWSHSLSRQATDVSYLTGSTYDNLNPAAQEWWLFFSYVELSRVINLHPTYFGIFIAFCVIYLFYSAQKRSLPFAARMASWVLIVYFNCFIVFLSSRIVILSLFALLSMTLIYNLWTRRSAYQTLLVSGLIAGLAIVTYINPISRYRGVQEIVTTRLAIEPDHAYRNSYEIRYSLWWLSKESVLAINPLIGAGTGDVVDLMKTKAEENRIQNVMGTYDPHNQYMHIMIAHGAFGLITFLILLLAPMYLAWRRSEFFLLSFLFLLLSVCMTESFLEVQKGIVFFAIFFPILSFRAHSAHQFDFNANTITNGENQSAFSG